MFLWESCNTGHVMCTCVFASFVYRCFELIPLITEGHRVGNKEKCNTPLQSIVFTSMHVYRAMFSRFATYCVAFLPTNKVHTLYQDHPFLAVASCRWLRSFCKICTTMTLQKKLCMFSQAPIICVSNFILKMNVMRVERATVSPSITETNVLLHPAITALTRRRKQVNMVALTTLPTSKSYLQNRNVANESRECGQFALLKRHSCDFV